MIRALQAAVSSSYLQKLAPQENDVGNSSGSADDDEVSGEGLVLVFTPAVADEASAREFVGTQAFEAAGGQFPAAFIQEIPAKLRSITTSLAVRFCWLPAEQATSSVDMSTSIDALQRLAASVEQNLFKNAVVRSLAAAAHPSLDATAFTALLGLSSLSSAAEVGSDDAAIIADLWPSEDADLDGLKALVNVLNRPVAAGQGKGKLKLATTNKSSKRKGGSGADGSGDGGGGVAAAGDGVRKTGRGRRLTEKAMREKQQHRTASAAAAAAAATAGASGPADGNASVGVRHHHPVLAAAAATAGVDVEQLSLEAAAVKITTGITTLLDSIILQAGSRPPAPSVTGPTAAEAIQKLVSSAFAGVAAHDAATAAPGSSPEDLLTVGDIRIALGPRTTIPAEELTAQHAARVPYAGQTAFAWKCAAQVLLRLALAAHDAPQSNGRTADSNALSVIEASHFDELLALMRIIVATMQPILVGAQSFFRDVIQARYGGTALSRDVVLLKNALWESEESDEIDADGGVTALRNTAASLEMSGETPEAPSRKVAVMEDKGNSKRGGADGGGVGECEGFGEGKGKEGKKSNELLRGGNGYGGNGGVLQPQQRSQQQQQQQRRNNGRGNNNIYQNNNKSYSQQATASLGGGGGGGGGGIGNGGSQSMRSDGSGVHGSASAATAGTAANARRNGALPDAEFLSRRYANSKQYKMQLRVGAAPQNARAKQMAVAIGGVKSHQAAPSNNNNNKGKSSLNNNSSRRAAAAEDRYTTAAVPDTPIDAVHPNHPHQQEQQNAAAGNGRRAGIAAPRQLFSPSHPIATTTMMTTLHHGVPPSPLEDAVPNTTPREMRAMTRIGPNGSLLSSPLRQPFPFASAAVPGAIVPSSYYETDRGEAMDVDIMTGAPPPRAPPPMKNTWFAAAVVPRGKRKRVPIAAAAAAAAPPLVQQQQHHQQQQQQQQQQQKQQEEAVVVAPAPVEEEKKVEQQEGGLEKGTEDVVMAEVGACAAVDEDHNEDADIVGDGGGAEEEKVDPVAAVEVVVEKVVVNAAEEVPEKPRGRKTTRASLAAAAATAASVDDVAVGKGKQGKKAAVAKGLKAKKNDQVSHSIHISLICALYYTLAVAERK